MLLEQKQIILDFVKQLDEPKKQVIPQLVASWLEKSTDPFTKAEKIAYLIISKEGESYHYEVEKERFYEVVFREDESDRYLLMELGEKYYEIAPESENDGYRTQYFTESEIKAIDERYWSFAVPVEEVAEG
ncbi:DUF1642 domain-containing protein [Enterococcus faecium]|nr:DUF1642 domain-containing protein [Enterococcus faecium]